MMKLILGLLALAAIPFEVFNALNHVRGEPIENTWQYFVGTGLTMTACGFGLADMWHHFRHVKEQRHTLAMFLLGTGNYVLGGSLLVLFFCWITIHIPVFWPLWFVIGGLVALCVGALIEATVELKYPPPSIEEAHAAKAREAERRAKESQEWQEEQRRYYREHPEEKPPPMPSPNSLNRPYIS
jgi:hypothetical protein